MPVPAGESGDKWAALRAPVDEDGQDIVEGKPFVREEQEKRLRKAERDLSALGRVNPLALEEFAALEERHQFLSTQLEDLKSSRKDLLDIIKEVDERVQTVFAEAFEDTAAQFVRVFARLFPGGEGRLVLTDPSDMLTTGIEVEARPAGQEDQAALPALRRRKVADGGGPAGGDLQGPALAVLRDGRGRGRPGRHQPGPPHHDLRGTARV